MYKKIVRMNDDDVQYAMAQQINDRSQRHYGGIVNEHTGLPSPSHVGTAKYIASMAAALVNRDSQYFQDAKVCSSMGRAVDFMLDRQHEDGTISLGGTNFNSPPDTGFVVNGLSQVYNLLSSHSWTELEKIKDKVKKFLDRTIPALLTGGCHTPNHRWVMTAALGSLYQIFKRQDLVNRADEWLAEGLDYTEDGEWTERSNGIYNTVSNIMLYYTAKYLDRPELLEPVRKNMKMMLYMIHPDGEVVTEYSGRQDLGKYHDLSEYFLGYRLMAALDHDPWFASMSDLISSTISQLGPVNNHAMLGYLVFPCNLDGIQRQPLPKQYEEVFNEHHPVAKDLEKIDQEGSKIKHSSMHTSFGAPVVRYRNHHTSMTTMCRTPSFFSLRHGKVQLLGMQVSTMFTPGVVEMEGFAVTENGYHMSTVMEKGYNGPVPAEYLSPSTNKHISPWYLLPHHVRPLTHVQKHRIEVDIKRDELDWEIRIKTDDRADVITQISLTFNKDCTIAGEGLKSGGNQLLYWTENTMRCTAGDDWMEISSGAHDHRLPSIRHTSFTEGTQTVVVNLLSPFEKLFSLRLSK